MHSTLQLVLLGSALIPIFSPAETAEEALIRATAAVQAATPRAQADPARPIFHVASPAQWVNDPNGPIFHKGYYHLFYQLHPFSDQDGQKFWGHVRSRDLAQWEQLPIALAPSGDKDEEAIWSGSCTINGLGQPMIFYTSIARGKSAFDHAEQWAATSDDDLIHWQKSPANPVLSEALHGERKIYDWRDPFVFHEGKRTFLVAGGHLATNGQASVNIYEAQNAALTSWTYRGVLFQVPDAPTAECPNFFKLGNQWVLFVSPYGKVQYFIGDFDSQTCRFSPRSRGLLDYGPNFYAPNTMLLADGRRLVWGWVNGFSSGHGWNGCLSIPRELSISRDGSLRQSAASQLKKLRGKGQAWHGIECESVEKSVTLPKSNALEIEAEVNSQQAKAVEMKLESDTKEPHTVVLHFDATQLAVMDVKVSWPTPKASGDLKIHVFVDRSVLEVLVNDVVSVTKTIPVLATNPTLSFRSDGGAARFKSIQAWPIQSIWDR
ncbi:MAG TPA: glycoside hydrolase family 32 protein [Candidatus Limnocylindrales bacterium]|nr:glycoside hydrolase family 32 protein [Candidatus Limnocylindrales bacterium]